MPEDRHPRGLLDTSVIIELDQLEPDVLPLEVAVSALTMAELAAGPHATADPAERARRQDRLQRAEAAFDPLPFDGDASRGLGWVFGTRERRRAQSARGPGRRLAHRGNCMRRGLPLYTRNPDDFQRSKVSSRSSASDPACDGQL